MELGQPRQSEGYAGRGFVRRLTNEQLAAQEEADRQKMTDAQQASSVVTSLSAHIHKVWQAAKQAKQPHEIQGLKNIRQRDGIYEADEKQKIKDQGGSDIFIQITGIKCHALKSWLKDIMIPAGERPFSLDPTPIAELPPEYTDVAKAKIVGALQQRMAEQGLTKEQIAQDRDGMVEIAEQVKEEMKAILKDQAEDDAQLITREVNDQLTEGNWYNALDEVIDDIVDMPCGFIHGPIVKKKPVLEWVPDGQGKSFPQVVKKIVREYERISFFDLYPSPGAKNMQQGSLIHRKRFYPFELSQMMGVPGWDDNAIQRVLVLYGVGGLRNWISIDQERADLEGRQYERSDTDGKIDALKFMGKVQGRTLHEWGMSFDEIPEPNESYDIIAYLIGDFVVSAKINPHPLGKRRYYSASVRKKNDSIYGQGVPQIMHDNQRICNGCARALMNNMAWGASPQFWAIVDRIPADEVITEGYPGKLWKFTSAQTTGRSDLPMGSFNIQIIVDQLLNIFKFFYDNASEVTGIPAYVYGSEKVSGAGQTASGLSMLLNAAGKGIKSVAGNIDHGIVAPSVEEHWLHIMLTEPEKARGDIKVVPRASDYLIQMEQLQIQIAEILGASNNPTDIKIMGLEGRAEIWREHLKHTKLPHEKIIPDRESIVNQSVEEQVGQFIQNIAQQLKIPPQQLLQMAQGQQGGEI